MVIDARNSALPASASARPGHRTFIEALGVAVYLTDADGLITDYNEAAVALWGRRPEVGDAWCGSWRLFWPDGTPLAHDECPMAIALHENRAVRGLEAIAERPDGSRVVFIPYPTPLRDAAGRLTGAVNVLVDITARKSAEEALRASEGELRAALAAKDEFLGLVSHELRTPITTILGNAQILHRSPDTVDSASLATAVADIYREAMRLNRTVEDLLTLARLEGGRLEAEPIVLGHVVRRVVEEYRASSSRDLRIASHAGYQVASGDANLVSQVLRNYLSNAEKYSPPQAAIDVTVEREGHEVVVRVLDRGIGVRADEAERIFEPFYRSSDVGAVGGMGIGLAVCQRLMAAVDGRVWAAPRDGGGSEFAFALRACEDEDDGAGGVSR
jgi:PAS domain S-box-containing protein